MGERSRAALVKEVPNRGRPERVRPRANPMHELVLDLQRDAGNAAVAAKLGPSTDPQDAEEKGISPNIAWIDALPAYITTQIDGFSEDFFDKNKTPEKQKQLLDKRSTNRTTFMRNMRPYLGSDGAIQRLFTDIKPIPGTDLWAHVSTRERLLAVKADVEEKGSPMPRTSVGQALRGRHLHEDSKAGPGAGMMTHAMGFAIDWNAYSAPHVLDPKLHALFETVTDNGPPAIKAGTWKGRHDAVEAMGKGENPAEGEALIATFEKEYERLVTASEKFKTDLPPDSMKPLREVEEARWAIVTAQKALKAEKLRKGRTKESVKKVADAIAAAVADFDAKAAFVRANLATIFEPWTKKLDARLARIEAKANEQDVDLDKLTGAFGFKSLAAELARIDKKARPHVAKAKAVLRTIRSIETRLHRIAVRIAAAQAWLADSGGRGRPDVDTASRWRGDLAELGESVEVVRTELGGVQSQLGSLLPGAKVEAPAPKPGGARRIDDSTIAVLRKDLAALSPGIAAAQEKLAAVADPLSAMVDARAAKSEDIAERKAYLAETTERLGGGASKAAKAIGNAAVKELLDQKLKLLSLKGAKDALLTDAGGFVLKAKSVRDPAITQLLGLMGGTEGGGFFTPDKAGGEKAAKKKEWSSEHGFNLTFMKSMLRHGFEAGVAWEKSPDTMHFELVEGRRLLESGGKDELAAGKVTKFMETLGLGD
ncbi:MAG TPA: hypothetical protein VM143_13400 [Acidimicrobiales bacterium]|nr:hypothetical protein [Acidimicrobiales bacterium]